MSHWTLKIGGAFEWTCISIRGVLDRSSRKPGYWGFQDSIGADDGFVFFYRETWEIVDFAEKWFGNGVKKIWKSANAHPSNATLPKTWPALCTELWYLKLLFRPCVTEITNMLQPLKIIDLENLDVSWKVALKWKAVKRKDIGCLGTASSPQLRVGYGCLCPFPLKK